MIEVMKSEDWRKKGGGKPVIKREKNEQEEMKEGEEKGERGDEEKEKIGGEKGVTKEELLQRQRERSGRRGVQIGVGETKRQEKAGTGVKWGTTPNFMGGDFLLRGGQDMPSTPIGGQVGERGDGQVIPPTPIRVGRGQRDSRTVVLLLSALLAASLPQGNSH